jgi:hypothetical protein
MVPKKTSEFIGFCRLSAGLFGAADLQIGLPHALSGVLSNVTSVTIRVFRIPLMEKLPPGIELASDSIL